MSYHHYSQNTSDPRWLTRSTPRAEKATLLQLSQESLITKPLSQEMRMDHYMDQSEEWTNIWTIQKKAEE